MLSEYMESVELAVETCLDNAELGPADVDGVLMVGGSSRIPAFQELLRRYFGQEPQFSRNLDEDVARGAALMGAIKTGTAAPLSPLAALPAPVDRSSHAIGVAALNDANVLRNFVVLPANSPIPTVVPGERIFGTHQEGQDQIELIVNEGDDEDSQVRRQARECVRRPRRPQAPGLSDHGADDSRRRWHPVGHCPRPQRCPDLPGRGTPRGRDVRSAAGRSHGRARRCDGDLT